MRLTKLLLEHPLGATPATHAVAALMCLHAARLPARVDVSGNLTFLTRIDPDGIQSSSAKAKGYSISQQRVPS